jgi:Tol biopolymer transport system component
MAGVAVQTIGRGSIAVGPLSGLPSDVIAESGAQPFSAQMNARGDLFYSATVPNGVATFRSDGKGGGVLVGTDLVMAVPSPDAKYVVGGRRNVGLVRVNTDGSGSAVILPETMLFPTAFTPGGAEFVFISNKSGQQQPWMLPLSGGEARRLSDVSVNGARLWLSRDGGEVIFSGVDGTRVCAFPAFEPCRAVTVAAGPFSADGRTVFAVDPNDPRNVLAQPIDGGTPTPLTRFTDKEITDFSLSPDRSQIAITRIRRVSDVVLIKGLK